MGTYEPALLRAWRSACHVLWRMPCESSQRIRGTRRSGTQCLWLPDMEIPEVIPTRGFRKKYSYGVYYYGDSRETNREAYGFDEMTCNVSYRLEIIVNLFSFRHCSKFLPNKQNSDAGGESKKQVNQLTLRH